jgi:hypothetical protein
MEPHTAEPSPIEPLQLARSLAMPDSITETDRCELIGMLHEMVARRRASG